MRMLILPLAGLLLASPIAAQAPSRPQPRVTPRDALQTHYLIDALLQSAAQDGAPVDVRR